MANMVRRLFAAVLSCSICGSIQATASTAHGAAHPSAGCAIGQYTVVAVPLQPAAINDAAQVAGTTASHRAALWTARTGLQELPLPPGFYHSEALAINNRGRVVGIAYDQSFGNHQPFIYSNGVLTMLPGEKARAFHINDSNDIAGESLVAGGQTTQPIVWRGNSIRPLGGCCGGSTRSINDRGEAIGDAYDDQGRYYAYLWTEALGLQRIGPADGFSSAIAINNRGDVVIQAVLRVLLYSGGSSTRLAMSTKYPTHPRAINDCDVIVGSFGPFSDADRAFVWEKSIGFQDLNALVPANVHWKLESATGINNRGEIVGRGDSTGADNGGFMLIPAAP
jgi:uncharacterized membrane protein